jgi:predicted small lipoprotein YifL
MKYPRRSTPRNQFAVLALAGMLLLSACGIKGELETPPPIWGEKASETQPEPPEPSS